MELATSQTNSSATFEKLGYSKKEFCKLSGFGLTTVCRLIKEGEIPTRRLGRRVIILRDEGEAWLRSLPTHTSRRAA